MAVNSKRLLGRWDSIAIIIGIVIGVGIFRVPGEVASYLASPRLFLFAWLLGGAFSLVGALCYAELSSSFPVTGGNYIYLKKAYGQWSGFLFGWTELLAIRTGSIAAVAFIFGEYLCSFLAVDAALARSFAISAVVILSAINSLGLMYGKKAQDALTAVKMAAFLLIIAMGFSSGRGDISHFGSLPPGPAEGIFGRLGLAMIPILWTYGGWHENTFVAEETRDAGRSLPFALLWGIGIITISYLALNSLYVYLIPISVIKESALIGSDSLRILAGSGGQKIFEAIVLISSAGSINAMIMTGSRITYAMARDNAIFSFMGRINEKFGAPARAICLNAAISVILIIYGTFGRLLFFTGVLVWLFYAFAAVSIYVLRKKYPKLDRPYSVWGYPVTPALFFMISAALFVNTFLFNPANSMIGLGIMLLGIPVYLLTRKMV